MNQEKTFEDSVEDFFLDIFDKEAEVFPKAFFPKTYQKFKSYQSLSGAFNLQSVNRFVFTGPSSTMTPYFGKE
jgi:hypothetical protein